MDFYLPTLATHTSMWLGDVRHGVKSVLLDDVHYCADMSIWLATLATYTIMWLALFLAMFLFVPLFIVLCIVPPCIALCFNFVLFRKIFCGALMGSLFLSKKMDI